jgi:hypothetical protein
MSTIPSQVPPFQSVQSQQGLAQSLRDLSARARPAVQDPDNDGSVASGAPADAADAVQEVARQNRQAALNGPAEAAAANKAAVAGIASGPASALRAQSGLNAEVVRRLVVGG